MTEKVKLTREQGEAIELYKSHGHSLAVFIANNKGFHSQYESLKALSVDEMGRLLYAPDSYEVEDKYKVGDEVIYPSFDCGEIVVKVIAIQYEHARVQFEELSGWKAIRDISRHATPEEIKAEQERRVWAKIGRGVMEFRHGDSARHINDSSISDIDFLKACYKAGTLKGFYPAESFVSFGGGEDA